MHVVAPGEQQLHEGCVETFVGAEVKDTLVDDRLVDLRGNLDERQLTVKAHQGKFALAGGFDERLGQGGERSPAQLHDQHRGVRVVDFAEVFALPLGGVTDAQPGGEQHLPPAEELRDIGDFGGVDPPHQSVEVALARVHRDRDAAEHFQLQRAFDRHRHGVNPDLGPSKCASLCVILAHSEFTNIGVARPGKQPS